MVGGKVVGHRVMKAVYKAEFTGNPRWHDKGFVRAWFDRIRGVNMAKYPTPNSEGYYWAKLVHPSNMPESEDWASADWEIVEVLDNNGDGDEEWGVFVPGISPMQWLPDFIWGPKVERPKELRR